MGLIEQMRDWGSALLDMIYPRCCEVCGSPLVRGEADICLQCLGDLPRCRFHTDSFNPIHQRLAGHVPIEKAAGYFYYYRDNRFTKPIIAAKYQNRPGVARTLARYFAAELMADGFFDGIDRIIPVPMHRLKELKRGYNQTDYIAEGLAGITGIETGHNLVATRSHGTQTRRGAFERWVNSLEIYECRRAEELEGRHVLIVDDVITSGATMLACCEAVHKAAPTARISVLGLGVTALY